MNSILEPVAKRLFDGYYRYCRQRGMEEFQFLTEEAYKLNERLRKYPGNKPGLLELDEFLLLKALRNFAVHQGEFEGEVFSIKRSYAEALNLDLGKVCLVRKSVVNQSINFENRLKDDAEDQQKNSRIRGQLSDFGDFYNLEPVIYNFMVRVYELLTRLKLAIPGEGFKELDTSYKKEIYYRYAHFVPVNPVDVDPQALLDNLVPLEAKMVDQSVGLPDPEQDPWKVVGALDVDCAGLTFPGYTGDDYANLTYTIINKIAGDPDALTIAQPLPNYIGMAYVVEADGQPGNLTGFSLNEQKLILERCGIHLDEIFYDLAPHEFLVLYFDGMGKLWPVVVAKQDLSSAKALLDYKKRMADDDSLKPAPVDAAKRKNKAKRKLASKARKQQKKRKK